MTDAEREIYSRCSVILTHLLDRLVFGDSHDFLLFEHEVTQAQRDEQPLEVKMSRLYVFRIQALWNLAPSRPQYSQKSLMQFA